MQFIDNTGHIFEMQSYSEYPIGFEYETTPYIFWLNSEYSNKLSVRNYYVLPVRMLFESTNNVKFLEIKNIESNIYSFGNIDSENIEIKESELKKEINLDDVYFLNGIKGKNSLFKFNIGTFYVFGYAKTSGSWMTTMCIHYILEDDSEFWCPITVGGTYEDECEELVINARNIGVQLPKDIIRAVYNGQTDTDTFDEHLYNIKLKEYLLNHMTIKGQCGNYNSVLASLEWFGWGKNIEISKLILTDNEFIEQYIHDYFDINNDILDSFKKFKSTTYIALSVYANQETERIEKVDDTKSLWGEGKPILEDLFNKSIEVEKNGLKFLKHYYDYTFNEMLYKLACLSYMLKKYFLPIHLSIHSATVQEKVFANDIKYLNNVSLNLTEKPILIGDNMNSEILTEVTFEDTGKYILSNQTLIVDDDYNIFNYYDDEDEEFVDFAENSENNFILIDDKLCVEIPIYFNSYEKTSNGLVQVDDQIYNCVLILRRNNITIHESHFSFSKGKEIIYDKENNPLYYKNDYKSFVVIPKIFNENINADFWENGQFTLDILCNGLWYRKDFILDVPEFIMNFNKLEYKYDYDLQKQLSVCNDSKLDFNAFIFEPGLVTFNDVNFDKEMVHLCKHIGLGAFSKAFSSDFNINADLKLLDYYISLTEQSVKIVDNDKYLNRIYIYNITDKYGNKIQYNGTERFKEEKDNYTFTQEILNLYKDFFTETGDQKINNESLSEYDFYLMHDDVIKVKLGYFLAFEMGLVNQLNTLDINSYKLYIKENKLYTNELLKYFNNEIDKMINFFNIHQDDMIEIEEINVKNIYTYIFNINGLIFKSYGWSNSLKNNGKEFKKYNNFYGVFISRDTLKNINTLNTPDEVFESNGYILRKYKANDLFLINRMRLVENEGLNHFTNEDVVVASIQNNENLAFNMSLGSKWEFKHISLGAEDIEPVTSKTNVAIMSVDKEHIKYIKGYYNVTVNYSIDDYYSHNKTLFGKILIK